VTTTSEARISPAMSSHQPSTVPPGYRGASAPPPLAVWPRRKRRPPATPVFALWYWELDRGGPDARRRPRHRQPDFLFPQMVTPACAGPRWAPGFVDYLYVSFTNATAFSPTDTMPLTPWAKMLLLLQALASLLTVALVAARAVNILP